MKIAFCGSSGTGKTSMSNYLSKAYSLPICPVGARSVAAEMGLNSPYESDVLGKRDEFQRNLLTSKHEWEQLHKSFITDRTHLDNLTYNILHNGTKIKRPFAEQAMAYCEKYDVIFYTPSTNFINLEDPIRVRDINYHYLYDWLLISMMNTLEKEKGVFIYKIKSIKFDERVAELQEYIDKNI